LKGRTKVSLLRPTLAQIYVRELRGRLDGTLVPLFPPDTRVRVGDIGYFDRGQFISTQRNLASDYGIKLDIVSDAVPGDWNFSSEGAVSLIPEASVSVGGVELLRGRLSFTANRAVVVSFSGLKEEQAVWASEMDRALWSLYITEQLPMSHCVVWAVRACPTATIIVNRKAGTEVEIAADSALLGGILSFQGLGAGVKFVGGSQASLQLSGSDFIPFMRAKGLTGSQYQDIEDVKKFESTTSRDEVLESEMPDVRSSEVEGRANWQVNELDQAEEA
jgi:hypothetical protein